MKIIHLSDIHIGKSNNLAKFIDIVDWIIANKQNHGTNVIVITGDIVDDGSLGNYNMATKQIDRLKNDGFIVMSVPGNHDYGKTGITENMQCMHYFKKYISDTDYPHKEVIGNTVFILLDSMLQEMRTRNFWGAQGELGRNQLNELERILIDIEENDPQKKVVVALHHHPFYKSGTMTLRDNHLFKKIIMDDNGGDSRIDCLLFGHKHDEKRFSGEVKAKYDKEKKYNIGIVYSSGATTSRRKNGKMIIPIIDIDTNTIDRIEID